METIKINNEQAKELIKLGRDLSDKLVTAAVENAPSNEAAVAALYTTYRQSISTLATFAFNDDIQLGKTFEEIIKNFNADLTQEYLFMKNCHDQVIKMSPKAVSNEN